nr:MAG TPA: hypothetical protein [Bacteriophage sp.]
MDADWLNWLICGLGVVFSSFVGGEGELVMKLVE